MGIHTSHLHTHLGTERGPDRRRRGRLTGGDGELDVPRHLRRHDGRSAPRSSLHLARARRHGVRKESIGLEHRARVTDDVRARRAEGFPAPRAPRRGVRVRDSRRSQPDRPRVHRARAIDESLERFEATRACGGRRGLSRAPPTRARRDRDVVASREPVNPGVDVSSTKPHDFHHAR